MALDFNRVDAPVPQTEKATETQCAALIPGRLGNIPCNREAKYEENGQKWCAWHAPSRVAARRNLRDKRRRERDRNRMTMVESEFSTEAQKRAEIEAAGVDLNGFAVITVAKYHRLLANR